MPKAFSILCNTTVYLDVPVQLIEQPVQPVQPPPQPRRHEPVQPP